MEPEVMTGLEALVVWALTFVVRIKWPAVWANNSRLGRMFIVAVAAAVVAIPTGLATGLAWPMIVKSVVSAFALAVAGRQVTKRKVPVIEQPKIMKSDRGIVSPLSPDQ